MDAATERELHGANARAITQAIAKETQKHHDNAIGHHFAGSNAKTLNLLSDSLASAGKTFVIELEQSTCEGSLRLKIPVGALCQPRSGFTSASLVGTAAALPPPQSQSSHSSAFEIFLRAGGAGHSAWSKLSSAERKSFEKQAKLEAAKSSQKAKSTTKKTDSSLAARKRQLLRAVGRPGCVTEAPAPKRPKS
jgi:hypothetical protein